MISKLESQSAYSQDGFIAAMAGKIDDIIIAVNRLEESPQGVVNDSIIDGARIQNLQEQVAELDKEIDDCARECSKMEQIESSAENVQGPITLIDIFNEMGRLYSDLWNKIEDMHYELKHFADASKKIKGGDNE